MANGLENLRLILGHGREDTTRYTRSTIYENVSALSPELLQEVSQIVVEVGHKILGRSAKKPIKARCDSKPVKTNVHFPTDLSLLRDALHCVIRYSHKWATRFELSGWREYKSLCKKVNKACHAARKGRKKSYNHAKVNKYLRLGRRVREKVERGLLQPLEARFRVLDSRSKVEFLSWEEAAEKKSLFTAIQEIYLFLDYMELFSDQIDRRILQGQKIPHEEKVFSVFKPFTRWIVKGKVGILCELGVPVAFVEDEDQFILGYGIQWTGTDQDIAVPLIKDILKRNPTFRMTCSFDTGFYSSSVLDELNELLETTAMPKKGGRTKEEQERQNKPSYKNARQGHPGVESCMNYLNHRGLSLVREVSAESFERVIATSVLAANLCRLGTLVREKERKRRKRLKKQRRRYQQAA